VKDFDSERSSHLRTVEKLDKLKPATETDVATIMNQLEKANANWSKAQDGLKSATVSMQAQLAQSKKHAEGLEKEN
jgi:uncharacterized protein YpuA (DUF1002 family)